ncbi:hypothetical protein [Bradyrhizobium sp. HKCCYLS3013]|uniref:hypothetical protein n=1 Tax=Bradyrhizobium sp. HKCCYLS3013 TaxID=3420735 RepID=UPI003EC12B4F
MLTEIFNQIIAVLSSPSGTAIVGVTGIILGAIPLALYAKERRSNEAIKQITEQFGLAQKIKATLDEAQAQNKSLEQERAALLDSVKDFEADIKERLPREAKIAFLKNAIPAIEDQIHALVVQKDNMVQSLAELSGPTLASPAAKQILSSESDVRLSAKRKIETLQIQLSILTGLASIILYSVPSPLDRFIVLILAVPLGVLLFNIATFLPYVYPDALVSRFVITVRARRLFVLLAAVVGSSIIIFGLFLLYLRYFRYGVSSLSG